MSVFIGGIGAAPKKPKNMLYQLMETFSDEELATMLKNNKKKVSAERKKINPNKEYINIWLDNRKYIYDILKSRK